MRRRFRKRYIVFALLGGTIVFVGLVAWQIYAFLLPFPEKFRRSKPALDAYAAKVTAIGPSALSRPPSHIGYFDVLGAEPLPHGFILQSNYGNPFDWNGLAYSTTPLPEYENGTNGEVKQVFTPVQGNWYTVFRP